MNYKDRIWNSREYYRGCVILSDLLSRGLIDIACYESLEHIIADLYDPPLRYEEPYEVSALTLQKGKRE